MVTSLSDLIAQVRMRGNMENNFFVTDSELTGYINNSLAELDDILVTEYEDYRLNNFQAVIPNDGYSNSISIPSDMNKLRGVDIMYDRWTSLFSFQFTERNRYNGGIAAAISPYGRNRLSYRLADQGIMIMPQQQAYGKFQVWYTPKFNPLLQLTDILPIQMDTQAWVEYAVVDCCIKIFNKQNLDPSGFMAEKAALKQRIVGAAKNRDTSGPKRTANVRFNGDDCYSMGYNSYDSW